jgi:hypothetical protein
MNGPAEEPPRPQTQPSFSGRPPGPPKIRARGLEDSGGPEKTIRIPDPVEVRELAMALKVKPFNVVGDLMDMRVFRHPEDRIDFETAARLAAIYGYKAERLFSW